MGGLLVLNMMVADSVAVFKAVVCLSWLQRVPEPWQAQDSVTVLLGNQQIPDAVHDSCGSTRLKLSRPALLR